MTIKPRALCAALTAAVLLLLSLAATADGMTVYIPDRVGKLGLPEMPEIFSLKTETDRLPTYGDPDDPGNPCPVLQAEDAKIVLTFSRKPDWAGVTWSDGWENLAVDEYGTAVITMEGHSTQPGIRALSGPLDPITGKPEWRWNDGGDYAYVAGLGPVTCEFGRSGSVRYVEYTVEEDVFLTGIKGAAAVIRWEPASIKNRSESDGVKYETTTTVWYVSSVTASYPAGYELAAVRAEYRNDRRNTLSGYTVTYALGPDETCAVTYMPETATILEEHNYGLFLPVNPNQPPYTDYTADPNTGEESPSGLYLHHYTADEPLCGEYTVDGRTYVSGSGANLDKWYEAGHGRQLKKPRLRGVTSFPSPRVR